MTFILASKSQEWWSSKALPQSCGNVAAHGGERSPAMSHEERDHIHLSQDKRQAISSMLSVSSWSYAEVSRSVVLGIQCSCTKGSLLV